MQQMKKPQSLFVCIEFYDPVNTILFALWFNVPVNNYGHVGMVS